MAMSHSCHTDICNTVRRFSRLLLHNSVISERKSFFTSSSCSVCFDCRMSVATTFRITAETEEKINCLLTTFNSLLKPSAPQNYVYIAVNGVGFHLLRNKKVIDVRNIHHQAASSIVYCQTQISECVGVLKCGELLTGELSRKILKTKVEKKSWEIMNKCY